MNTDGASSADKGTTRNEALCALLAQLGWSLGGFASRIRERCAAVGKPRSVSTSTVSRWCSTSAVPGAELVSPACHVLSVALRRRIMPETLGWPSGGTDIAAEALHYGGLDHAVWVLPRLWELDSVPGRPAVRRMSFGGQSAPASHQALVMLPDVDLAGKGQQRVSVADIELLELHTSLYGSLDARYGGRFRSVFASFLDMHATPLLNGSFSARLGRRLYGAVADAVLSLANMAYDNQLFGLAQRYDLQAMRLAQAIGDRGRLARGHIHQARLASVRGDVGEVLTHARSAVIAAAGTSASVRAYAAISEARAWAFHGDQPQTIAAVERAREAFQRNTEAGGPAWLSWLDRTELEGQAAWAFARVGLEAQGTEALNTAMDMPGSRTRDYVELLITGAELARLRDDDAEHSTFLKRAIEASRHVRSKRLADRLERAAEGQPIMDF